MALNRLAAPLAGALLALSLQGALAQASPQPGLDPGTTKPQEVEVPERGSLPAAGGTTQSAAPGIANDCQKNPSACSEPVQTGSTPKAPGLPEFSR